MVSKFVEKVTDLTKMLVGFFAAVMTVVIVSEVVMRYAFSRSIYFAEELSRLSFVWAGFLATSLALRKGVHASVQLVVGHFPKAPQKWVVIFSQTAVLFFLIVIFVAAITVLPHQWGQLTPTMEIRMFWFYLSVPIGVGLMIIQLLPQIQRALKGEEQ
jgi:C4-dicarboxylate transporter, DctQ subunit